MINIRIIKAGMLSVLNVLIKKMSIVSKVPGIKPFPKQN